LSESSESLSFSFNNPAFFFLCCLFFTACNSLSYLAASFIGIPAIERWGRRKMMIFGAAGQAFCFLMITACLRYADLPGYAHAKELASASVAFFFLYYVFFSVGWQGIPFLYPAEINSIAMRTRGMALSTATSWAFNYMVVQITPLGATNLQWRFYIIWLVTNVAIVPTVYLFYPETADRSLEDMERFFKENHDVFVFRSREATSVKRPQRYVLDEQTRLREVEMRKEGSAVEVERVEVV